MIPINWNGKAFKKMTNLETLIIKSGKFSESPRYLPNTLKVLIWERYPLKSLSYGIFKMASEISSFSNFVYLKLTIRLQL